MKRQGFPFGQITSFLNLWRAAHKAWRGKKEVEGRVADFYFNLSVNYSPFRGNWFRANTDIGPTVFSRSRPLAAARSPPPTFATGWRIMPSPTSWSRSLKTADPRHLRHWRQGNPCRGAAGATLCGPIPIFPQMRYPEIFPKCRPVALKTLLDRIIKDHRTIDLLSRINYTVAGHAPGKGIPIGNLTSQHFANLYLGEMDHFVKERLRVAGYLRYMDDFLFFGPTKSFLHEIHFGDTPVPA